MSSTKQHRRLGWPRLLAWVPLLALPFAGAAVAMSSPWWENYEVRETFLCNDTNKVVVERNDAQASLLAGRSRTTLFREDSPLPGLRYGTDRLRLILRGDELTLERLPQRLHCLRTDQV
ncbi:hypothetical protein FQK07_06990 [Synechococcus sp. BSF8S]|uniref:hypothetical protein n=2 Tax=Cyanophyceae TaxID=3028117 RepID=UPI00162637D0|nr:hypothetical protein [Synechococcus sp. BSA11S]MBC1261023.1 hypothetical protein [Synechococcus sp. BSF8S]MBC1263926.1 hypothetical protein [Synechococcus sp. BSA11S]